MERNQRENTVRRILLFGVCLQRWVPVSFNVIVPYQRKGEGSILQAVHRLEEIWGER